MTRVRYDDSSHLVTKSQPIFLTMQTSKEHHISHCSYITLFNPHVHPITRTPRSLESPLCPCKNRKLYVQYFSLPTNRISKRQPMPMPVHRHYTLVGVCWKKKSRPPNLSTASPPPSRIRCLSFRNFVLRFQLSDSTLSARRPR